MSDADKILAEARKHLGMSGRPNPPSRWYAGVVKDNGFLSAAWCDMFVSWVANNTGLAAAVGRFAYCPSHINWFKKRGQWGTAPKKGAIVFFDWEGDGVSDHVGIVEAVNSDGTITTLEGNTSNAVKRKIRSRSVISGYGYPAYSAGGGASVPAPAVSGTPYPGTLIRRGNSGSTVRRVQNQLIKKGFKLPKFGADGDFGSETESTVKAFQKKNKLQADGIVGPDTWKKLFS